MALLEKAAGQGHAHAMQVMGRIHDNRNEPEHAMEWYTKGAPRPDCRKRCSQSVFHSTKGKARRRRIIRRRQAGTGGRQTLEAWLRRSTSPTCTLLAAVWPGR